MPSSDLPAENATTAPTIQEQNPDEEDENELELPEEEEEEEIVPKTKAEALKLRMRKLKMKMNQARQLNQREVLREGERLGSAEGAAKAKKRQMIKDKKSKEAEWKSRNSKALELAQEHGVDGKYLVEQADSSLVSVMMLSLSRGRYSCSNDSLFGVPEKVVQKAGEG